MIRTAIEDLGRRRPSPTVALWCTAVGVTILLQWQWMTLYMDIRYTFGALRAAGQAGSSAPEVFIHRPMAHRALMSLLDHLTFGATEFRERLALSIAIVCAGISGAWLSRSLRDWLDRTSATYVGLAAFAALAWAPTVTVLQPEWTAVLLSVAAIAAALGRQSSVAAWRSPWLAVAGTLLALAALQKYTTATTVVVALGVLVVVSWRRGAMVAGWTVVTTVGLFLLTLLNRHEYQWFREMPELNDTAVVKWSALGSSLWYLPFLNPIVMFLPAAVILGYRLSRRRIWWAGPPIAAAVVMAGVAVQNAYYLHHYAALSVLAGAVVALACALWIRRVGTVPSVALVGLVWMPTAWWLSRRPLQWRADHVGLAVAGEIAVIALSIALAVRQPLDPADANRPQASWWKWLLTAAALALLLSFPAWPRTPALAYTAGETRVSEAAGRDRGIGTGRAIHEAAGGAEVVYAAGQQAAYFIGLPTACRYPTPTFLARSTRAPNAPSLASFQENLGCVRDRNAKYLVLNPQLIERGSAVPSVRQTIAAEFDCQHPVLQKENLLLCARRR